MTVPLSSQTVSGFSRDTGASTPFALALKPRLPRTCEETLATHPEEGDALQTSGRLNRPVALHRVGAPAKSRWLRLRLAAGLVRPGGPILRSRRNCRLARPVIIDVVARIPCSPRKSRGISCPPLGDALNCHLISLGVGSRKLSPDGVLNPLFQGHDRHAQTQNA